jgi:hypothetical protein
VCRCRHSKTSGCLCVDSELSGAGPGTPRAAPAGAAAWSESELQKMALRRFESILFVLPIILIAFTICIVSVANWNTFSALLQEDEVQMSQNAVEQ